eukprot:1154895-Pelagomonas_calceolata.AAC.2
MFGAETMRESLCWLPSYTPHHKYHTAAHDPSTHRMALAQLLALLLDCLPAGGGNSGCLVTEVHMAACKARKGNAPQLVTVSTIVTMAVCRPGGGTHAALWMACV